MLFSNKFLVFITAALLASSLVAAEPVQKPDSVKSAPALSLHEGAKPSQAGMKRAAEAKHSSMQPGKPLAGKPSGAPPSGKPQGEHSKRSAESEPPSKPSGKPSGKPPSGAAVHNGAYGMRIQRRADAGRHLHVRANALDSDIHEMYAEFLAKAKREGRQAASYEEFLKHPKVVKKQQMAKRDSQSSSDDGDDGSDDGSSLSSSGSASASSSSSSGTDGETYAGQGTYYSPGLGSCGKTSSSSDKVVAVSHKLYDQYSSSGNSNSNELCGKQIKATYNGKSTTVTVVDRCTGCSSDDLDFSPSAFRQLASTSVGRLRNVQWSFVE
ncbi:Lytic transglycosylase [Malassezia yamatoensis]|uniref:Lytic transglycosylase n=1 Tax=Malassezia yamatoensis TaxID=253288 RepID=A0AAJ5YNV7_9BASI|nr:Lytic transglycosylase [Malassezia yamatoensis]